MSTTVIFPSNSFERPSGYQQSEGERPHVGSWPIPAAGPHTWTGNFGLGVPGSAAFMIFTAEGNEHGSNPVAITRPVEKPWAK